MYDRFSSLVDAATSIVIIQPENPDADSLSSSLALEDILGERGKDITMYCAIDMPKYLRYISGSDRVTSDWTGKYDLAIIVDTASALLLEKALAVPGVNHFLQEHDVIVVDHHGEDDETEHSLPFSHEYILGKRAAATGELIYEIAQTLSYPLSKTACEYLFISIMGDTLGLTTPNVTPGTFMTAATLVQNGVNPSELETARRAYMKKPADILTYKGRLLERIEYYCDGKLATIHIPWEEIAAYSDRYNPSVLVLDEMRLVEGVEVAVAIKTYPDGKLTGKIRSNRPIAEQIAGYFGGGGHAYSAGYKIFEEYDKAHNELITATDKILNDYESA